MNKGIMIRILQAATVLQFVAICVIGFIVFWSRPDSLPAYGQLVGIITPIFITEVIPALIGSPLSDAVRNMTEKKNGGVNECSK